jgi:hypothetical protein
MKPRIFLTLAAIANLIYGLWYFLAPQGALNVYGFGAMATPLSLVLLQFLGIFSIAEGVMCGVARNSDRSPGRTAVIVFVAVSGLLCFYLDVKTVMGEPGTMDWVDMVVNGLFGFGAVYFLAQDMRRSPAGPPLADAR